MCLILFAYHCHPTLNLVVAANRDEYHDRPAQAARFWPEQPHVLAGRDLRAGGTWMGVSRRGRFAAVTNFREPSLTSGPRSRGELCTDFLDSTLSAKHYLAELAPMAENYGAFNLLLWDGAHLVFYSNQEGLSRELTAGIYGMSNGLLNEAWPKVTSGRLALAENLARGYSEENNLDLLTDRHRPADADLPSTGVGMELERLLAPRFICSPDYGTRTSSVMTIDSDQMVRWVEQSYDTRGITVGKVAFEFSLDSARGAP